MAIKIKDGTLKVSFKLSKESFKPSKKQLKWLGGLLLGVIGWVCIHEITGIDHWTWQDIKLLGAVILVSVSLVIMDHSHD